jgi:hypothetical protein
MGKASFQASRWGNSTINGGLDLGDRKERETGCFEIGKWKWKF